MKCEENFLSSHLHLLLYSIIEKGDK